MLGLRLTFHRPDTRPQLTDGTADWLWPAAERHGIPLMVHVPERLPKLAEIAARHPGLTIIVDHMGFGRETMDANALGRRRPRRGPGALQQRVREGLGAALLLERAVSVPQLE